MIDYLDSADAIACQEELASVLGDLRKRDSNRIDPGVARDLDRRIALLAPPRRVTVRPVARRRERCGTARRRATSRASSRSGDSGDDGPPAAPARRLIGGAR